MNAPAVLTVTGLRKSYDDVEVLKGVDVEFREGEFVAMIGLSGAGKSTFIRCVNRLVEPSAGTMVFDDGVAMEKLRGRALRRRRQQIGMIFQHYNLVGRVNVIKNVMHGVLGRVPLWKSLLGLYPQEDKREALALLHEVGLGDQVYKRGDALSGGQMQRVGICRAVMQKPRILLADEPIASLDPKSSTVVMDALARIVEGRGLCAIVNLHQVDVARQYADRILGLRGGRIIFDGPPSELTDAIVAQIYAAPGTDVVADTPAALAALDPAPNRELVDA